MATTGWIRGPLLLHLPNGKVTLPVLEADEVARSLGSFGPEEEMPTAHSAGRKLARLLAGESDELLMTNAELFEVVHAIDRLTADRVIASPSSASFRHMLALEL